MNKINFIFIFIFNSLFAQKKISVASPNKEIIFTFKLEKGQPQYSVAYKGKSLIENSKVGLTFIDNVFFGNDIEIVNITTIGKML